MRLSSVTTHGKIAIGRPGHMNTTEFPAIGVLRSTPLAGDWREVSEEQSLSRRVDT
jgi:hypothetical protein